MQNTRGSFKAHPTNDINSTTPLREDHNEHWRVIEEVLCQDTLLSVSAATTAITAHISELNHIVVCLP